MARALVRLFDAIMVLSAVMSMTMLSAHAQWSPSSSCPTGVANFGDSITDTGNACDAFPFTFAADFPPYGESKFFGKPAKRFSNGRLIPDFFSLAFGFPLLDAYLSVDSFNYKYGINFANAGSNAAFSTSALEPISLTPFQVAQFFRFQNSTLATQAQAGCANFNLNLPLLNPFGTWLYTIVSGSNDLLTPLLIGEAINSTTITQAVGAIVNATIALYQSGARQFLIYGLPAGGCSPVVLTLLSNVTEFPRDGLGCVIASNEVVQDFNYILQSQIQILSEDLRDASIAFFDFYSANIAILSNPTTYGFKATLTTQACCGASGYGNFNYNPTIACGKPGTTTCANPDEYVSWDGIHYTENFYRQIAKFALNRIFTEGGVNYTASCNLDFSQFPSSVTFQNAYPVQFLCNNLYT